MARRLQRSISAAIVMVFLMVFFIPQTSAEQNDRYGYSLLENDKQRTAYNSIAAGIGALETEIVIPISGITSNDQFGDISIAADMVRKDYPEYFWYHGVYTMSSNGQQVTFIPEEYTIAGKAVSAGSSALAEAQAKVNASKQKVLSGISANASDYEISHAIHDYIVDNVTYKSAGDHQTAYGALAAGEAVCAGYARAYQLLMNAAGISCWYVEGQSYDKNGNLVAHAWNLVWLDGKCYYSDATWDDQSGDLFHEYMNMSLEDISKTHFTSDPLPTSCGHNDYTFFMQTKSEGLCDIQTHKSVDEVASCFKLKSKNGTEAEYYCTIHYHGDDFHDWIGENIITIAQKIGYVGKFTYSIIELDREHHVTIVGNITQTEVVLTEPTTEPPTEATTEPATESPTEPTTEPPTEPTTEPPTEPPTQPPIETTQPETTAPETQPSESTVPPHVETTPVTTTPIESTEPSQTETVVETTSAETTPVETIPQESSVDTSQSMPSATVSGTTEEVTTTAGNEGNTIEPENDNGMTILYVLIIAVAAGTVTVVVILVLKKKGTV